ncbi:unnamed protein product [Schistosoma haematobium]|nr:unnamed protein product [Schistosoma haematobium]
MEQKSNDKLSFLDVLIPRTDRRKLKTQVYRKSTNIDQIINYISNSPRVHKINCLQTLFKRSRTHSITLAARENEEKYLKTVVQKNGYPINFNIRNKVKYRNQQMDHPTIHKRHIRNYKTAETLRNRCCTQTNKIATINPMQIKR